MKEGFDFEVMAPQRQILGILLIIKGFDTWVAQWIAYSDKDNRDFGLAGSEFPRWLVPMSKRARELQVEQGTQR